MTLDTPVRLYTPPIDASYQLSCLAGIAEDETNISLLLSNFDAKDTSYQITLDHLPWNSDYSMVTYTIDENHHLQITKTDSHTEETLTIGDSLRKSTVQLIRLTNSSVIPDEGPVPAEIPFFLRIPLFDVFGKILGFILLLILFS
jgi:hypothetical protein